MALPRCYAAGWVYCALIVLQHMLQLIRAFKRLRAPNIIIIMFHQHCLILNPNQQIIAKQFHGIQVLKSMGRPTTEVLCLQERVLLTGMYIYISLSRIFEPFIIIGGSSANFI